MGSVEEIDVTDSQRNRYQKIAKELYKEYGKYFGDSNDGNSSRYGLHPSQSAIGLAYAKIVKSLSKGSFESDEPSISQDLNQNVITPEKGNSQRKIHQSPRKQ